jgi:3-oxoacyl-[acyl-carrier-protein] synthase-3
MTMNSDAGSGPGAGRTMRAGIRAIATFLPETVLSNEELARVYPDWPAAKILEKTGIRERRIAAEGETAADLAFAAAVKLFDTGKVDRSEIDFVILCTQAPDYVLPTTACILQERLGLRRNIGAFDMNLGCSGFVYGLAVAGGLIEAGAARNVLLLTADTYSKFINPGDKSVRTLFGDGAAATLVSSSEGSEMGPFVFGTDGSGAEDLIVKAGGARMARSVQSSVETAEAGNTRSADNLYMNGPRVMAFALREVPRTYKRLLELTGTTSDDLDFLVLHQGNGFMLDALQKKLGLSDQKVPRYYETVGNTVSSTIPFVLENIIRSGHMAAGERIMLIGFGVGLSWAGTVLVC